MLQQIAGTVCAFTSIDHELNTAYDSVMVGGEGPLGWIDAPS